MTALSLELRPSPVPEGQRGPTTRAFDGASITAGLAYVSRCLRGHRPFGIVTGSGPELNDFLARVAADCAAREELHTVRINLPTDSAQTFLAVCLAQLGFELRQASLDDLHRLLIVFLRHESARGRRTVAIIEGTDQCGPHLLQLLESLSKIRAGATPAMTFVLVGSPGLHRILDSRGMSGLRQFTRERFDLDRSIAWVAPLPSARSRPGRRSEGTPASTPPLASQQATHRQPLRNLVVMLDGAIIERRELSPGRLLIGRGPRCDLLLDSRFVSRHHAAILVTADSVSVVDLCSTNTTLVNGQVTARQKLEHGDLLAIGNFRIRYDCRPR